MMPPLVPGSPEPCRAFGAASLERDSAPIAGPEREASVYLAWAYFITGRTRMLPAEIRYNIPRNGL